MYTLYIYIIFFFFRGTYPEMIYMLTGKTSYVTHFGVKENLENCLQICGPASWGRQKWRNVVNH